MGKKLPPVAAVMIIPVILLLVTRPVSAAGLITKTHSGSVSFLTNPDVDLGTVDMGGGVVERVFEASNGGSEDLVLKGAFTSCACTVVTIETPDGTLSKPFGMPIPTDWFRVIRPGERFKVRVRFDPAYHGKKGTGVFHRDIYLITSAAPGDNGAVELPMVKHGSVSVLRLKGEVVSSEEDSPPHTVRVSGIEKAGDFRLATTTFDLGIVKQSSSSVNVEIPFIYEGKEPVRITGTPTSCGCVTAHVSKKTLSPGERGVLTVVFDPNFHKEPEGRFFKDIIMETEPAQTEEVRVRLWAQIDLDLGEKAYKNKGHDEEGEKGHL